MAQEDILAQLREIKVWKQGDQRAPHKPLLLLYILAKLQRGEHRLTPYKEIDQKLKELLVAYGPPRRVIHPEHPFWYLQNDGSFWEIPERAALLSGNKRGDVSRGALLREEARGGFSEDVYQELRRTPALVNQLVSELLAAHFPSSLHEDILNAVGMPWVPVGITRRRDPAFRETVLRIYEHRCAICGYDGKLEYSDLGLEAAHIRWHACGGPDTPENGLALCAFHHKIFDRGALGLDDEYKILVSQRVHGQTGTEEWLYRFAGKPLRPPQAGQPPPHQRFLRWHREQVFRGPARAM